MKKLTYLMLLALLFLLTTSCSNDYSGPFESDYAFYNPTTPDIILMSDHLSYTSADTTANGERLFIDFEQEEELTYITITSTTPIDAVYFDGYISTGYEDEQAWYYGTTGEVYSAMLDIPNDKIKPKGIYNGFYSFQISRSK